MTFSLAELRAASDEELIARHDEIAKTTGAGVNYYLEELARRDQQTATEAMLSYTRRITWLTGIVTLATLINVALGLLMLICSF